jgi:hypothetical protein
MSAAVIENPVLNSAALGHVPRGVRHDYVHLDAAMIVAADQVSAELAQVIDGQLRTKAQQQRGKAGRPSVGFPAMAAR